MNVEEDNSNNCNYCSITKELGESMTIANMILFLIYVSVSFYFYYKRRK